MINVTLTKSTGNVSALINENRILRITPYGVGASMIVFDNGESEIVAENVDTISKSITLVKKSEALINAKAMALELKEIAKQHGI